VRWRWGRDLILAIVSVVLILGLMMAFTFGVAHLVTSVLNDLMGDV